MDKNYTEKNMPNEKANYIKGLLKMRGETMTSLALKLGEPFGTVANNINGYRTNKDLQERIANFLGHPAEDLFVGNGQEAHA